MLFYAFMDPLLVPGGRFYEMLLDGDVRAFWTIFQGD